MIQYHRGEYKIILRLIRVLNQGNLVKQLLDYCIDINGDMENLRFFNKNIKMNIFIKI